MFQRTPGMIIEKPGDGPYSYILQTISLFLPWTQWLTRVGHYALGELFYWGWGDGWFGKVTQNKIWNDARSQIKSEKLAKEILFKQTEINGCKRPGIYTQFYRFLPL